MKKNRKLKQSARDRSTDALLGLAKAFRKKTWRERPSINRRKSADVWADLEAGRSPVHGEAPEWSEKFQRRLLGKKNKGERSAEALLKMVGATYERERFVYARNTFYFIDFMVTSIQHNGAIQRVNVALEIDGSIHELENVKERDAQKEQHLLRLPFVRAVLRIDTERLKHMTIDEFKTAILTCERKVVTRLKAQPMPTPKTCSAHTCTYPKCICS